MGIERLDGGLILLLEDCGDYGIIINRELPQRDNEFGVGTGRLVPYDKRNLFNSQPLSRAQPLFNPHLR